MTDTFDLNSHIHRLLLDEPFFACMMRNIRRCAVTDIPTAAVGIDDEGSYTLIYNPEFMESLPDIQKRGVIKHECYHLLFEHITLRMPKDVNPKIWNYATDLAINSYLMEELPKFCLFPGKGPFIDLHPGESSEWYLAKLKAMVKESGGDPDNIGGNRGNYKKGKGQFDSHDSWGKASDVAKSIAAESRKKMVKEAYNEAQKAGSWGTFPIEVRRELARSIRSHVDWKKVLPYFIKTAVRSHKRSTVRRLNKKYPYIHPGSKVQRTAKIAISIDQSGSVSDSMLEMFFAQLNGLAKLASFHVVPFDTNVAEKQVYEWKKGEKRPHVRVRWGGTNFDAPTKYVNENNFDGHIILTDLAAPKPIRSRCPRMWMTTEYYARRPYFKTNEKIIVIK